MNYKFDKQFIEDIKTMWNYITGSPPTSKEWLALSKLKTEQRNRFYQMLMAGTQPKKAFQIVTMKAEGLVYCGAKKPNKNQKVGTYNECVKMGQIRQYGIEKVPEKQTKKMRRITKPEARQKMPKKIRGGVLQDWMMNLAINFQMTNKQIKWLEDNFVPTAIELYFHLRDINQFNHQQAINEVIRRFDTRLINPFKIHGRLVE